MPIPADRQAAAGWQPSLRPAPTPLTRDQFIALQRDLRANGMAPRPTDTFLSPGSTPGHSAEELARMLTTWGEALQRLPADSPAHAFVKLMAPEGLFDQLMLAAPVGEPSPSPGRRARAFEPRGAGRTTKSGFAGQAKAPTPPPTMTAEDIAALRRDDPHASPFRTGRIPSSTDAQPPDTEAALATLSDWVTARKATTAQIRPSSLEMRNVRRSKLDARGPRRPESVREAHQLERFRPKLEAQIAETVAAARSESDPIRKWELTNDAQDAVERWHFLYTTKPGPTQPTADFPTRPFEGRSLMAGAEPSPFQHAAPVGGGLSGATNTFAKGSEAWLAKLVGASPGPKAGPHPFPGGVNLENLPPGHDLQSEVAAAFANAGWSINPPKPQPAPAPSAGTRPVPMSGQPLSGMDRQALNKATSQFSNLDATLVTQAKSHRDAYIALANQYGLDVADRVFGNAGFTGIKLQRHGKPETRSFRVVMPPDDLPSVVGIKMGGRIFKGRPGEVHGTLLERLIEQGHLTDAQVNEELMQGAGEEGGGWFDHGFITRSGKYISREEASAMLKRFAAAEFMFQAPNH